MPSRVPCGLPPRRSLDNHSAVPKAARNSSRMCSNISRMGVTISMISHLMSRTRASPDLITARLAEMPPQLCSGRSKPSIGTCGKGRGVRTIPRPHHQGRAHTQGRRRERTGDDPARRAGRSPGLGCRPGPEKTTPRRGCDGVSSVVGCGGTQPPPVNSSQIS